MSAIYGYINLSGMPLDPAKLETMRVPMEYWGPHGQYTWHEGSAGFGLLQCYNTPESVNEHFPLIDPSGNLLFFFTGRIDNREELICQLSIVNCQLITDSALAFAAYQQYDKACVDHLVGDWSFVVWNKSSKELFLARDHHGITGLYYYFDREIFVFSSCVKGLLALDEIPKTIDQQYVALIMSSWPPEGHRTARKEIFRLPPSHWIEVGQNFIQKHRYFYLEHTPELLLENDQEYFDRFLEIYTEAVRCRLRSYGRVGAKLSGGLDSGSVCVLAANMLNEKGERLQTFTHVPFYKKETFDNHRRFGDETYFVKQTADFNGNIDTLFLETAHITPLDAVNLALTTHDEPLHAAGNQFWIYDIDQHARQMGITTMLNGQHGNATASWPLPRQFEKNKKKRNPFINTVRRILKLTPYKLYRRFLKPLSQGERLIRHSDVSKKMIEKLGILDLDLSNKAFSNGAIDELHRIQYSIIRPGSDKFLCLPYEKAAMAGLEYRDPTNDIRLLRFMASIPSSFYEKHQTDRIFIKKCFAHLMPREVIFNKRRGLQAADLASRITGKQLLEIENVLKKYPQWIKPQVFQKIEKAKSGKKMPHIDAIILLRSYMAMKFLEQ